VEVDISHPYYRHYIVDDDDVGQIVISARRARNIHNEDTQVADITSPGPGVEWIPKGPQILTTLRLT